VQCQTSRYSIFKIWAAAAFDSVYTADRQHHYITSRRLAMKKLVSTPRQADLCPIRTADADATQLSSWVASASRGVHWALAGKRLWESDDAGLWHKLTWNVCRYEQVHCHLPVYWRYGVQLQSSDTQLYTFTDDDLWEMWIQLCEEFQPDRH